MNDLIHNLKETIKGSDEFIAELSDTALEAVVDSDTLSKIPVISWAIQAFKIKDSYQLKKIQRNTKAFLEAMKKGDSKRIDLLLSRISEDETYKEEFIDNLYNIIFESEKPLKAEILGNLLIALYEGNVTQQEYNDLSLLLIQATIPAINSLISFIKQYKSFHLHGSAIKQEPLLLSLGIASRNGTSFRISALGEKLYTYGLEMLKAT